ncbi:DUF4292 domain-containing protein [Cytophaga aurantiaca]|uniref:DUF4292 domain-containing protein n=1 Tax=Cytophaga aurantiaca TaxID=29530 RepID=UPI0003773FD0|nr:DUF4292 domain-containing protein [Cytophaga aurantiaca]
MNRLVLLIIAISFLNIACKKVPVSSQLPAVVTKSVIDFHPEYVDFVYLTTKTKLEYSDGTNNDQYALSLRVKKDSVIWASIGKAGVEGVRGLLRPDSLFILDKMKNDAYSYDLKYLQNLIQSNLSYYNIQNLLIGDLLFPYSDTTDVVTKTDTHFIVVQKKDNLNIESFVRLDNMKVEKANITDAVALSKTTVTYSNYILSDSILAPSVCTLDIEYKKNGQILRNQLVLTHSKIEFTTKPLNFPFNVPKKFNEK